MDIKEDEAEQKGGRILLTWYLMETECLSASQSVNGDKYEHIMLLFYLFFLQLTMRKDKKNFLNLWWQKRGFAKNLWNSRQGIAQQCSFKS